jgi:hypothetical protein
MILYIGGYAQGSTISAIVDGKKTHEKVITDTPSILTIQRAKFKNVHSLVLVCRLPVNKVYKRSVDFTDQNDLPVYHVQESKLKPGTFIINASMGRRIMAKEKIVKVYLDEEPSNDLMALPSHRKLLIEIHFI